ncbi:MAG: phosphodiesterase [Clostridioides sp.]|jgi:putative phosphoesterase|nr:phosphodiesterase [Clostridioides sp.]
MKIGILSDTHGSLKYFEKAIEILSDCDLYFHAGDIIYNGARNTLAEGYDPSGLVEKINAMPNIVFAKGNCDALADQKAIKHPILSPYAYYQIGGFKCIISHGYEANKESFIKQSRDMGINLLIFGHTHVKEYRVISKTTIINPGSTTLPRDDSRSVAKVEIMNDKIVDVKFYNLETKQEIPIQF